MGVGRIAFRTGSRHDRRMTGRATGHQPRPSGQSFDFGFGPVAASRHRNPDGTLGGWVALTAHADPETVVADTATVFDNARVFGESHVLGRARVFDFARVTDGSVVAGDAAVSGSVSVSGATVSECAEVSGHARVERATVRGGALVTDNASVNRGAIVQDRAVVRGQGFVTDGAVVAGTTVVEGPVRGDVIVLDGHVLDDEADDAVEAPDREDEALSPLA
jgi:carbonic anhydrase/acetyltransferase-like protein (isoleucine patch superfamily)